MRPLPTEVLQGILEAVHTQSREDADYSLPVCLRVCSEWRDTGLRLIYTDIALRSCNLAQFVKSQNSASLAFTRSLSLKLFPEEPSDEELPRNQEQQKMLAFTGTSPTQFLWRSLRLLTAAIPSMRSLETFFLTMARPCVCHPTEGFSLHHKDIASLISAIPASLRNLEIDTMGYDIESGPSEHLCPILRKLLARLHPVRLHLARLYPALLQPVDGTGSESVARSTRLKTMVISFMNEYRESTTNLCGTPLSFRDTGSLGTNMGVNTDNCRLLRQKFLPAARANLIAGAFPEIVRLSVFDEGSFPPAIKRMKQFAAINERDILKNKTISLPFRFIEMKLFEACWVGIQELRYRNTNGEEMEVLGSLRDVEHVAEGPAWIETIGGSRFPAAFRDTQVCRGGSYMWEAPAVTDREPYSENQTDRTLWDLEAAEGRKLLHVRESDGLGEVGWVEREPTARERACM